MKSSKYWCYLLLVAPFLNMINFRVGELTGLLVFVVLMLLFVLSGKKHTLNRKEKKVLRISIFAISAILIGMIFSIIYSIDNFYYYRFFGLSFLLMPVFLLFGDSASFIKEKLLFILKYYIILISCSIIIGAVLMFIGLHHLEPMYDAEKWNYLNRPFGIFGQPSVNSSLLCFFYLFHRSVSKFWSDNSLKKRDWLFYFVTLGVIFQGSGSGFISYAFVLLGKFSGKRYKIPWFRIFILGGFGLFLLYQIVMSGVVQKISFDYITYLSDFISDELIYPYKELIKKREFLLWGVPDFPLSIDFGPLFMMGTIGLIMTVFIFGFLIMMLRKTNSLDMKLGFLLLIVGNLHYPVMFYMIMHFMWYIIVYYVIVMEKQMIPQTINKKCYTIEKNEENYVRN